MHAESVVCLFSALLGLAMHGGDGQRGYGFAGSGFRLSARMTEGKASSQRHLESAEHMDTWHVDELETGHATGVDLVVKGEGNGAEKKSSQNAMMFIEEPLLEAVQQKQQRRSHFKEL